MTIRVHTHLLFLAAFLQAGLLLVTILLGTSGFGEGLGIPVMLAMTALFILWFLQKQISMARVARVIAMWMKALAIACYAALLVLYVFEVNLSFVSTASLILAGMIPVALLDEPPWHGATGRKPSGPPRR